MTLGAKNIIPLLLLACVVGGALILAFRNTPQSLAIPAVPVARADFSAYPPANPAKPVDVLFIHHSCGGQLLSAPGPDSGSSAIYSTHPNAGGLRMMLQAAGYVVHEASYDSRIGDRTDIFDWPAKFRTQMDEILTCAHQNEKLPNGQRNRVVVFKSCYPNNDFVGVGSEPGNAQGPDLTYWNARAAYETLLPEFRKYPEVLFICVTAPPLAEFLEQPFKRILKRLLGRHKDPAESSLIARSFNNWLASSHGWLRNYEGNNVVVFDYYDTLTKNGATNFSAFCTVGGRDSHPSAEGNQRAAQAFLPFLNQALQRSELIR